VSFPGGGPVGAALVVGGNVDTRFLIRSLLRLHQVEVVGDADGENRALELLRVRLPTILVTDFYLSDGDYSDLIACARALRPGLRVILIAPAGHPPEPSTDLKLRADVVLRRPFPMHEFAEALRADLITTPLGRELESAPSRKAGGGKAEVSR
jgi:DNA-binding NarL/FixJ family response regulator